MSTSAPDGSLEIPKGYAAGPELLPGWSGEVEAEHRHPSQRVRALARHAYLLGSSFTPSEYPSGRPASFSASWDRHQPIRSARSGQSIKFRISCGSSVRSKNCSRPSPVNHTNFSFPSVRHWNAVPHSIWIWGRYSVSSPRIRGSRLRPSTDAGISTPAISRTVGMMSSRPTGSSATVRGWIPKRWGALIISGIRAAPS